MSERNKNENFQQVLIGRGQFQSSNASDKALKLLSNKNMIEGINKPIDKDVEKSLESIRRFNQINEEIKKSYDENVAKTKQREKNCESLLKQKLNT